MAASLSETSLPRNALGDVSAMYNGATCMAVPIPKPNIIRPTYSTGNDGAKD